MRINSLLNNIVPPCMPLNKCSKGHASRTVRVCKAESDRELAEAQMNLGKLQNELSEKVRQVAEYDSELQKQKELVQSAEVDRNRFVVQHNNGQNEVLQLTDRVNELETRVRENNAKVEGPDDGHFIVKRAHVEIQSARNEARIAHEELTTARSIFNKKIEQVTAEHAVALDQSKAASNSLKSEVNLLTHNAKVDSNVTVNVVPNKIEAPPQKALQPSSGSGYQTPIDAPARSLSPSSSQVIKEIFSSFSAQLTALSEKVDRQAERPTRGRSSTRGPVLRGQPPMGGDGDPDDLPDEEDDDEDEWDDDEGDDGDNVRTYVATDCETTVVERRTREQDTVKVSRFPYLA